MKANFFLLLCHLLSPYKIINVTIRSKPPDILVSSFAFLETFLPGIFLFLLLPWVTHFTLFNDHLYPPSSSMPSWTFIISQGPWQMYFLGRFPPPETIYKFKYDQRGHLSLCHKEFIRFVYLWHSFPWTLLCCMFPFTSKNTIWSSFL